MSRYEFDNYEAFVEFLRSGKATHLVDSNENGDYIVVERMKFKKRGIKAFIFRLLRDERGWEEKNFVETLLQRVKSHQYNKRNNESE